MSRSRSISHTVPTNGKHSRCYLAMESAGSPGSEGKEQDARTSSTCHTAPPCDMCEDNTAGVTHRCIECGLLCESCAASHAKMIKLFRTHKVRLLNPDEKEETDVRMVCIYKSHHIMHAYVHVNCFPTWRTNALAPFLLIRPQDSGVSFSTSEHLSCFCFSLLSSLTGAPSLFSGDWRLPTNQKRGGCTLRQVVNGKQHKGNVLESGL